MPQSENYLMLIVVAFVVAALTLAVFHTRARRFECGLCGGLFRSQRKRAAHCRWHHES